MSDSGVWSSWGKWSGREDESKVEETKGKLEPLRTDWGPCQVWLVASELVGVSVLQNLGSFAMKPDMYIWSRSIRSEKTVEGKVAQWSAQLLYRTLEMSCQISESACELPNGCHLDPSLHISLFGIGVLGSVARPSQVDTLQCHYQLDWRRGWRPTPVFLPGESHGQRSLPGYSPWGCKSCAWLND